MRKSRKCMVVVLLMLGLVSTGCGEKKEEKPVSTPWDTDFSKFEQSAEPEATGVEETPVVTEEAKAEKDTKSEEAGVKIYYGDSNAEHIEKEVIPEEEVTPELLVKQLSEHDIMPGETKVNSFKEEESSEQGKTLRLDFSKEFQEALFSQGTAGEFLMMGSIVNTFLDAYDADQMVITVDGQMLESGHCIYANPMKYCDIDSNASAEELSEKLSEALGAE